MRMADDISYWYRAGDLGRTWSHHSNRRKQNGVYGVMYSERVWKPPRKGLCRRRQEGWLERRRKHYGTEQQKRVGRR